MMWPRTHEISRGLVEELVMNASDFLMSLIVVGLAALGGYGQEVRAEPPGEIATAVEQAVEPSGEATEEMREAKKAAGELIDDGVDDGGELINVTVITTIGEMMAVK